MDLRQNKDCTCIIPVFNEGSRVLKVLEVITQVKNLDSIICVDDGSSDNTAEIIKKHYKSVKVLKLKRNVGKSGAIWEGLKNVNTEYVLLMDGDLYNLKREEIESAIDIIIRDQLVDMLAFRRKYEPWFAKMVRADVLVTGERILRTKDLREVYKSHPDLYQIEVAINLYMMDRKKNVYWIPSSGTSVPKFRKEKFSTGLMKDLRMHKHILAFGVDKPRLAKTFVTFCRKQYPGFSTI